MEMRCQFICCLPWAFDGDGRESSLYLKSLLSLCSAQSPAIFCGSVSLSYLFFSRHFDFYHFILLLNFHLQSNEDSIVLKTEVLKLWLISNGKHTPCQYLLTDLWWNVTFVAELDEEVKAVL